jgi:hypothetical protein
MEVNMHAHMVPEFHGSTTLITAILIFFGLILPALVMWFDEGMYVGEVEKEQKDHTSHGHYV